MAQSQERRVRLKFKRILLNGGPLMPQGYRLATVEEIETNLEMFKKWELPVKRISPSYTERSGAIRLLDGWVTADFKVVHKVPKYNCVWNAVVKEKRWDGGKEKWQNCPDFYSSGGSSLREQLYKGIKLSRKGKEVAWLHAYCYEDVELLYWLWLTFPCPMNPDSFTDECQREDDFMDINDGNPWRQMVIRLSSHVCVEEQLKMEDDLEDTKTVLNNANNRSRDGTKFSYKYGHTWSVASVELAIKIYGQAFKEKAAGIVFAKEKSQNVPITTKFLHLFPDELQKQIDVLQFAEVLIEAAKRRYMKLVEEMTKLRDKIAQITGNGYKRALKEAVAGGYKELVGALLDGKDIRDVPVEVGDEEKTLFHYALPHKPVFEILYDKYASSLDIITRKDKLGRTVLHWATKGCYDTRVVERLLARLPSKKELIQSEDHQWRTPWHIAASKGDIGMINKLRPHLGSRDSLKRINYIQATDSFGLTALLIAASEGHYDLVKMLMDEGSCPLKERDGQRKTALHHAAQVKIPEAGLATCKALLEHRNLSSSQRSLLLWASATGIGTADEMLHVPDDVKKYLQEEKGKDEVHLLRAAAMNNNVEMAWEILSRGASIAHIRDQVWIQELQSSAKEESVRNVLGQLEHIKEQARDQPSMEDKLGRHVFAQGLAALFLNRFIESPITVGISGDWGMGKSSLMLQTEKILLIAAAQLTFPNLLPLEQFVGVQKISLSTSGNKIYQEINRGIHKLLKLSKKESKENPPLATLLKEYQPEYHDVYKALACMDNNQMEQEHAFRGVPRIITIRYNAWHYRNEQEAWAGLGVTISKEIEKAMTRAQWMSTCWRYTWAKQRVNIWIQIFLPSLLSIFLAGWVAWIVWMLLKEAKFHGLKYGSIPLTIIAIVWIVLKSVNCVVKPVSTQMLDYVTLPDHTSHLGYQEDVINDINFLKRELGIKPHLFFTFILWCWNGFGLCADNVENTSIPKCMPASGNDIRIVTFVDDLDRCEQKVVLKVLSAINLVLTECKINVILGMDKKMIKRAIKENFKGPDSDVAEKFISKIIQIPLSLPDPTDEETISFLEYHLRHKIPTECIEKESVPQSQRGLLVAIEPQQEINAAPMNAENDHTALDIDHCDEGHQLLQPNNAAMGADKRMCGGIVERVAGTFKRVKDYWSEKFSNGLAGEPYAENLNSLRSAEGVSLVREILLPNHTPEEAHLFYKLRKFTTGNQKLPREWKCLLSYHKFAWYVLSLIGNVYSLPTWKAELVGWVFVCWQWKCEMNRLIKLWKKISAEQDNGRNKRLSRGPSLSELVKKMCKMQDPSKVNEQDKYQNVKLQEALNEQDKHQNDWVKLQEALEIQDVSMEGIQLFQQFRLHCEIDHLPCPRQCSRKTSL